MKQKRCLAIHDISCIGRCSLTVALPIISALGFECGVLPTAILSTHTGGFVNYTFDDFTDKIPSILNHWKTLNEKFDVVYSGYLGSKDQIDLVINCFKQVKNDNSILVVDPVMADHGQLYKGFDGEFVKCMAKLCSHANVLTPNITEACFLLNNEYKESYTKDEISDICSKLVFKFSLDAVIITGINVNNPDIIYVAIMEKDKNTVTLLSKSRIPQNYHGTGDLFTSTFVGTYMKTNDLKKSVITAINYTHKCVDEAFKNKVDPKYGVQFERYMQFLLDVSK